MSNDLLKVLGANTAQASALEKVLGANKGFTNQVAEPPKSKEDLEAAKAKQMAKLEEEKKAAEEKRKSLETNQFFLSDMTHGALPSSGIDHILTRYPEGTWDKEHEVNIPEVDPFYVWDAEVLEMMVISLYTGEKALLQGLPGTGKTSAVRQLAAWIRQPFARFNGKGGIEPASFLGYAWAGTQKVVENGVERYVEVMEFKEGLMPQAVRDGYLTVIDEVMKLSPDVQMALQSLYERDGFLMLDDKPGTIADKHVHPRKEFALFVTDNTLGTGDNMDLFASSQMQDTSTLDRLTATIVVNYMEEKSEVDMLKRKFDHMDTKDLSAIVKFANLVRESYRVSDMPVTLSPRGLEAICRFAGCGVSLETAIRMAFGNKLASDSHKQLCREQLNTVM